MRLLIAALLLVAAGYSGYTFFKHRAYVQGLPLDHPDALRPKFKTRFSWAVVSVLFWGLMAFAIGIWVIVTSVNH